MPLVASTISQITSSYCDRVKVERSAQAGDEVVVDYEGTYNGERIYRKHGRGFQNRYRSRVFCFLDLRTS